MVRGATFSFSYGFEFDVGRGLALAVAQSGEAIQGAITSVAVFWYDTRRKSISNDKEPQQSADVKDGT